MITGLYSRQQLLKLRTPVESVVVGLGGTGTWTALFLAMSGVKRLHLMDFDAIEASNLNRLPYTEEELGMTKTVAASTLLRRLRPELDVMTYTEATELSLNMATSLREGSTIIFDCTDKIRIQRMIYEFTRQHKIPYMRVGYDGTHMTVSDYVTPFSTMDDDEGGYAVVPSWVCPAAVAAGLAVGKAMLGTVQDISMDIGEIGLRPLEGKIMSPISAEGGFNRTGNNDSITIVLETDEQKELMYSMLNCAMEQSLESYAEDEGIEFDDDLRTDMWRTVASAMGRI